jgi:predicted acyl esterase
MRTNRTPVLLAAALALPAYATRGASARDTACTAREFMIPMRDGAGLHTVVLPPGGAGPVAFQVPLAHPAHR